MNVAVIINPGSSSAEEVGPDLIKRALGGLGDVSVVEPSSEENFGHEIRAGSEGAELVVVVGGDGSMHHTLNALAGRLDELTFALVPAGTGNDLARSIGLPDDPHEAARAIPGYSNRRIDLAKATGPGFERLFVNACMGGWPVQVDEAVSDRAKKRLGPLAFWTGALKAGLRLEPSVVTIDGTVVDDCLAVGVGNGRTVGGGMEVWPNARLDDGALDCCAMAASGLASALRLAAKVKAGTHLGLEQVKSTRARRMEIAADPPVEFNIDGELLGLTTPASFEVHKTCTMRAPPGNGPNARHTDSTVT